MTPPTPEELVALELPPDVELRHTGGERRPESGVGFGLAGTTPAGDLGVSLRSVTRVEGFSEVASGAGADEADLAWSDTLRGLYLLATPGLAIFSTADLAPLDEDSVAVDATARPVLVRALGPRGEFVLRFTRDEVAWFEVPRRASAEMASLADWTPPPAPVIPAPDPDALLGGFDAPAWMTSPLRADPPRDAYGVCAAVGTLGRLWSHLGTTTTAAAAMARLRADDHPWARARRWFDALPAGHRAAVDALARVECGAMSDALDRFDEADREADRPEAVAWLERRDDLASITALLGTTSRDPLGIALAALDREAGVRATLWRWLSPITSPRLAAVAWQSPEAWWAEPAREG